MTSHRRELPKEDWSFEQLRQEAEDIRKLLNQFRTSLGRFFVRKQELIDLMVVAAVARSRYFWSGRRALPTRTSF